MDMDLIAVLGQLSEAAEAQVDRGLSRANMRLAIVGTVGFIIFLKLLLDDFEKKRNTQGCPTCKKRCAKNAKSCPKCGHVF